MIGMKAKATIHPSHIDIINEALQPSDEAIEHAKFLIEAFKELDKQKKAVFVHEGNFYGPPHLKNAQNVLERAGLT